ncbi:hypothetical protein [Cohnella soli]|uniref:Uncharacterized protein n=1 Tax=Cohnella soli TaxID=425005 RepID=A0ABW0I428_9BACL
MNINWDFKSWSSSKKTLAIATVVAFLSLFMPWIKVTSAFGVGGSANGWEFSTFLALVIVSIPTVFALMDKELPKFNVQFFQGPLRGTVCGAYGVITAIYWMFHAKKSVMGLVGTKPGFGVYVFLLASVLAIYGSMKHTQGERAN